MTTIVARSESCGEVVRRIVRRTWSGQRLRQLKIVPQTPGLLAGGLFNWSACWAHAPHAPPCDQLLARQAPRPGRPRWAPPPSPSPGPPGPVTSAVTRPSTTATAPTEPVESGTIGQHAEPFLRAGFLGRKQLCRTAPRAPAPTHPTLARPTLPRHHNTHGTSTITRNEKTSLNPPTPRRQELQNSTQPKSPSDQK